MAVYSEIDRKHASGLARAVPSPAICLAFIFLVISALGGLAGNFTFQEVAAFTNAPAPPANPAGGLIQGSDGNLYGTSFAGGQFGLGTVYQVTPTGAVTVVASFNGLNGANPRGTMVTDSAGNFYGVTYGGGVSNAGTIFKVATSFPASLTVLHDFYADPGQNPYAGLLRGTDGGLYGTTESYGMLFKITPTGVFSNLNTTFGLNGESLNSVLAQGADGNLYGVAGSNGYSAQGGQVFGLSTNGTGLAASAPFAGSNGGDQPFTGLVSWGGSAYVGAGAAGGVYGMGTLFFLTNTGEPIIPSISFDGTNGAYPYAPPLVVGGTKVYGGTAAGGTYGQGVVFNYNINKGSFITTSLAGTNGSGVYGQPLLGKDGFIYGTTRFGGTYDRGTVFKMDTNGNLTSLTSFPPTAPSYAGIIQAPNGNLYGSTGPVGLYGAPAVFQLTPGGTLSAFAHLPGTTVNSSLLATEDGGFYATTFDGGNYNQGTVTRVTAQGTATIIFSFESYLGANPFAGVIQGADGLLYGTTVNGGIGNGGVGYGTAFSMSTNGVMEMGADFTGANGANPYAPLIQAQDGSFYGTTYAGGASNLGSVFRVTSNGLLTSLYAFSGPDGANPYGGLVQGPDGLFYGTTTYGGLTNGTNSAGFGTLFQISTNSTLNTLVYFDGTNGANPRDGLILGPDGNFYGTTPAGGADNDGTVFNVTSGGVLTTVYSFSGTDGASPYAGLFFGNDGALYGETTTGGPAGGGNIFRIAQPAALQINAAGGLIQIAWPAFDSEFQLQASADLTEPNGWMPVMATLSTNGDEVMVMQPAPTNNVFYRLVNP